MAAENSDVVTAGECDDCTIEVFEIVAAAARLYDIEEEPSGENIAAASSDAVVVAAVNVVLAAAVIALVGVGVLVHDVVFVVAGAISAGGVVPAVVGAGFDFGSDSVVAAAVDELQQQKQQLPLVGLGSFLERKG